MFGFTAILGWFSFVNGLIPAPLRSLAHWIMIIIVIVSVAFFYLKYKEHEAAKDALIQFNQQQLELTQKENLKYKDQLSSIQKDEDSLIEEIKKLNVQVDQKEKETIVYIDRYKSKGLDPIFNDTIKHIRGRN